jgi:diguanylate cyclase (GGDEF)-like protein
LSESSTYSVLGNPSLRHGDVYPRSGAAQGPQTERDPSAWKVKLQVLIVCVAAGFTAIVTAASDSAHFDWPTFGVLAAAAAFAQLFVVHTTHNQSYHLAIVFVVAAALLLPPELVVLLCVIQHVPEWMRERYPAEIQGFNIANYTLAALGAWTAAHVVLGSHVAPESALLAVGGVVAGAVFVLFNHGTLAGMLRFARGHSLQKTGLFSAESLSTDFVLALIGIGLAAWWRTDLWFASVALAPLILIHRALSVPRLREEASLDTKTGLYNAAHLSRTLPEEIGRAARFGRPLSVIVADLDLLRDINNTYGHLFGDAVLQGVADTLRGELRVYDVAVRFGGEEFAVILPETEHDEAMVVAERIRETFAEQRFSRRGSDASVAATLSLGVASFPLNAAHADDLVHQADLALFRAKALGRNRVCGSSAEAKSNERLRRTHMATIAKLTRSIEGAHQHTSEHTERVAAIAVAIARQLGYRGDELNAIEAGALVHDVGKIGIPETVLCKPGPLTDDEWELVREHPVISDRILSEVDLHPFVRQIARSSHERIDGGGYPDGLVGDEIPMPARIVLVADAFDAMASDRPYRPGRSTQAVLEELRAQTGTQFCPRVVEALEHLWSDQPELLVDLPLREVDSA